MTASTPRFGIWANVYGTWASLRHPEDPLDASWERNRRQIQLAEELGFDSTLLAQLEAWLLTGDQAAHDLEPLAAVEGPLLRRRGLPPQARQPLPRAPARV